MIKNYLQIHSTSHGEKIQSNINPDVYKKYIVEHFQAIVNIKKNILVHGQIEKK